jgi:hypothetical protein
MPIRQFRVGYARGLSDRFPFPISIKVAKTLSSFLAVERLISLESELGFELYQWTVIDLLYAFDTLFLFRLNREKQTRLK